MYQFFGPRGARRYILITGFYGLMLLSLLSVSRLLGFKSDLGIVGIGTVGLDTLDSYNKHYIHINNDNHNHEKNNVNNVNKNKDKDSANKNMLPVEAPRGHPSIHRDDSPPLETSQSHVASSHDDGSSQSHLASSHDDESSQSHLASSHDDESSQSHVASFHDDESSQSHLSSHDDNLRHKSSQFVLSADDFNSNKQHFQDGPVRYQSVETWRSPDSFAPTFPPSAHGRPGMLHWSKYTSKGEYLQQPIIADYAEGAEKIFLMIKDGADVLWDRLPMHFLTTLTRVPFFAIYADKAGSVAGYEVIDVLANVTEETFNSEDFDRYRKLRFLHDSHLALDPSQLKIGGGWELDRFKNIPMLAHAYNVSPNSDWFVFMDADTYFFMDVLSSWLMTLDPEKPLYLGSKFFLGDLAFAHGGSGVVLSRKALELTLGEHPEYVQEYEKKAFDICCGDALVALMLQEKLNLDISECEEYADVGHRFQGESVHDFMIDDWGWCHQIQSFHHLNAYDIEVLYEYERLKGPKRNDITYADVYRDFYLPYITDKIPNWDNLAASVEYRDPSSEDYDEESGENEIIREGLIPNDSFESCKEACELLDWCLTFRFIDNDDGGYCGLSGEIRLGTYVNDWIHEKNEKAEKKYHETTSGWLVDRIRDIRKRNWCDPLYQIEPEDEGIPDGSEHDDVEGWYLRRSTRLNQEEKKKPSDTISDHHDLI